MKKCRNCRSLIWDGPPENGVVTIACEHDMFEPMEVPAKSECSELDGEILCVHHVQQPRYAEIKALTDSDREEIHQFAMRRSKELQAQPSTPPTVQKTNTDGSPLVVWLKQLIETSSQGITAKPEMLRIGAAVALEEVERLEQAKKLWLKSAWPTKGFKGPSTPNNINFNRQHLGRPNNNYECEACGDQFFEEPEQCPVCGSEEIMKLE